MSDRSARLPRRLISATLLIVASSVSLGAQQARVRAEPELRADVLGGRGTAVQLGAGVQIPAGTYVRVGVIGGVGSRWIDGASRTDGRVDVLGRFLIDPFRQSRWALSAGGGVSLRATSGDRVRPDLLVAADLEGPRSKSGVSPTIQVGLGGGVRAGLGLRWGGPSAR